MSEFDPYLEWLQIPADRRPPNYYDLLGLRLFESDPAEVQRRAIERMEHVRRYRMGAHGELSTKISNELSQAFDCLSDPERKAAYDRQLRGGETQSGAAAYPTVADTPSDPAADVPPVQRAASFGALPEQPLDVAPLPEEASSSDLLPAPSLTDLAKAVEATQAELKRAEPAPPSPEPPREPINLWNVAMIGGGVLAGLVFVGVLVLMFTSRGASPPHATQDDATEPDVETQLAAGPGTADPSQLDPAEADPEATSGDDPGASGTAPGQDAAGAAGQPSAGSSLSQPDNRANDAAAAPDPFPPPAEPRNPPLALGAQGTWSGTLHDVLVNGQTSSANLLIRDADARTGVTGFEAFARGPTWYGAGSPEVDFTDPLAALKSHLETGGRGDKLLVSGRVVNGSGNGLRLSASLPLVQITEIRRTGESPLRIRIESGQWIAETAPGKRAPGEPASRDDLLAGYLRWRPPAGTLVQFVAVYETYRPVERVVVVNPSDTDRRQVLVGFRSAETGTFRDRKYRRGEPVGIQATVSSASTPQQLVLDGQRIHLISDPVSSIVESGPAAPSAAPPGSPPVAAVPGGSGYPVAVPGSGASAPADPASIVDAPIGGGFPGMAAPAPPGGIPGFPGGAEPEGVPPAGPAPKLLLTLNASPERAPIFLAWSPDGTSLATASDAVAIWDAKSGQSGARFKELDRATYLEWSADGDVVVAVGEGQCVVWNVKEQKQVLTERLPTGIEKQCVSLAPDGDQVALFIAQAAGIDIKSAAVIYNVKSGKRIGPALAEFGADRGLAAGLAPRPLGIAWSPDGKQIALATSTGAAISRRTGRRWSQPQVFGRPAGFGSPFGGGFGGATLTRGLHWLPGSQSLLAIEGPGTMAIWDMTKGRQVRMIPTGSTNLAGRANWSPDGQWLAVPQGGGVRVFSLLGKIPDVSSWGGLGHLLPPPGTAVTTLAWHPSGEFIAGGGATGNIVVWDTRNASVALSISGQSSLSELAFNPEGDRLATAHSDGKVLIWDTSTLAGSKPAGPRGK